MSSLLAAVTGFRDGVYQIVQRKNDGTEANASLGDIGGKTDWSVVMDATIYASDINVGTHVLSSQFILLTRLFFLCSGRSPERLALRTLSPLPLKPLLMESPS